MISRLIRYRYGLCYIFCSALVALVFFRNKWLGTSHARISPRNIGLRNGFFNFAKSHVNILDQEFFKSSRSYLKRCLRVPRSLIGFLNVNLDLSEVPTFEKTFAENPNVLPGGQYSPVSCRSHWNVAIIIPFRGRELQLRGFLNHMLSIWQRQQLSFTVFVIQQAGEGLFNRAKLLNVGFKEASKYQRFDCFVFHDVDILLENDECLYSCPSNHSEVRHLSAYLDKYQYSQRKYGIRCPPSQYPYDEVQNFGGISMMTSDQFYAVNGFSNLFWGWGGEDDDMFLRIWRKKFKVARDSNCKYSMYKHEKLGERNSQKHHMHNSSFSRQDIEGLNSLTYTLISKQIFSLYTNITVDVGTPSAKMLELLRKRKLGREQCDGSIFLDKDQIW